MSKVEQIKAEIERLNNKYKYLSSIEAKHKTDCYTDLLSFINSLPEEKPSEDLEKVVMIDNVIMNMTAEGYNNGYKTRPFYEEVLRRLNARKEEGKMEAEPNKLSEDLEQAAEEWYDRCTDAKLTCWDEGERLKLACNKTTFAAGAKWQKEQMMKDAVEGFCFVSPITLSPLFVQTEPFANNKGFRLGETCKVIIVKED